MQFAGVCLINPHQAKLKAWGISSLWIKPTPLILLNIFKQINRIRFYKTQHHPRTVFNYEFCMATVTKRISSETDVQRTLHQIFKQQRKVRATKSEHLLASMHFSMGRSEKRWGEGDKTTLVLLYYLNISAVCDICFMQEESKNVWGGLCINLPTGDRTLRCQKYYPLPYFCINWASVKFANMSEAISIQNNKVTLCYLSDGMWEYLI